MNIVCYMMNHIDGVMVGVIDCGYEPHSGQTKDYEIDICCFFAKHTALWRKSKDWLARNQYNVSEWRDVSTLARNQYNVSEWRDVSTLARNQYNVSEWRDVSTLTRNQYNVSEWRDVSTLARKRYNVSKWGDVAICRLLFQWASTVKSQLSMLIWYKADLIIISLKINLFFSWYSWKIAELALNNNHSLTKICLL